MPLPNAAAAIVFRYNVVSIATFNVNSVKARLQNVLAWLDAATPDIVLLQELKCETDAFPRMEFEDKGYNLAIHGQKTYNGVAILSKFSIDDVITRLPGDDADEQARYIEGIISLKGKAIRVASAYVPNGQEVGSDKFAYKLKFYERLRAHWAEQLKFHEVAVLGADFNCAPTDIDVYDAKALEGTVCFHPLEREQLRALMNLGLYDAFRLKHPTAQKYSWWDYRAGAYQRDHGMRIDHLLLSPHAVDRLSDAWIDEAPRREEKPSDHAPVLAKLEF